MSESPDQLRVEIERLQQENEKLRASNRRWMRIAGTDDLTGLPNKVYFSTVILPQFISQASADGEGFVCVMVAPDKLGEINLRFGRNGGDQVVKEVAAFLKENMESDERIVHIDGANFIVMMPRADNAVCKKRTRQLRARAVSRRFSCGEESVVLTLSMGTVVLPAELGGDVQAKDVGSEVLRRLNAALDQAKKQGGDQVVDDSGDFS
jgi:two-component system cell cycle response regulator